MPFWTDLLSRVAKRQGEGGNTFPVNIADGNKMVGVTGDGKLKVEADINIDSVTATDVTIHDAAEQGNKLKVNADGSIGVHGNMQDSGLLANRPAASSVPDGFLYFAVDAEEDKLCYAAGSTWKVVE